ncbi:MAG: thioredoxin family protein [Flavisolibacter sp.]|jgi:thiol-disulfide isomerase/thioredoxin|nr:thioredoxin family protein [Flavisolibacter sp.]
MKNLLLFILASFIYSAGFAQPEVAAGTNGNKSFVGFITKKDLVTEPSFTWYAQNQQNYTPDANALQALRTQKDSVYFLVFGGTWCDDTRNILPKFFRLTEAAGMADDHITLVGVDASKKTIHHLAEIFKITNVPTIIVLKNGREVGRVIEYGKYGLFDKELGELLARK